MCQRWQWVNYFRYRIQFQNVGGKVMIRELIKIEGYMIPLRLKLVREVVPLLGIVFFLGLLFGYFWAMKAYSSFS